MVNRQEAKIEDLLRKDSAGWPENRKAKKSPFIFQNPRLHQIMVRGGGLE
jgi:hypothetical protein